MPLLPLVILALVQGLTEFLPVSSTAHLVLAPYFFGWADPGLDFDLALHIGTLVAVLIYLRRDLIGLVRAALRPTRPQNREDRDLLLALALATAPAVLLGFFAKPLIETTFRSLELIAWTTVVFGLLLYGADRMGARTYRLRQMRLFPALAIGLAQTLSLLPGVSRSGITMTAARALGFERTASARFSFLLSIPTIAGACLLGVVDILRDSHPFAVGDAAAGAALAFVAALASMGALMRWVERRSFLPFVVYRLGLGLGLFVWLYA